MEFVIGIITGIVAGYIASKLQKGKGSGCLVNLFLGLIGGVVGSWIFGLFGLEALSWLGQIVMAVIGAVIVLWIFAKIKG